MRKKKYIYINNHAIEKKKNAEIYTAKGKRKKNGNEKYVNEEAE